MAVCEGLSTFPNYIRYPLFSNGTFSGLFDTNVIVKSYLVTAVKIPQEIIHSVVNTVKDAKKK